MLLGVWSEADNTHFNHDFSVKPHHLAEWGTTYVKKFLIGFLKLSSHHCDGLERWGRTPGPLGLLQCTVFAAGSRIGHPDVFAGSSE